MINYLIFLYIRKNHLEEIEMREDVHVGLYIASLVALIPAIIIFFSYKYVIKNMQFTEKYPEKYGHSRIND